MGLSRHFITSLKISRTISKSFISIPIMKSSLFRLPAFALTFKGHWVCHRIRASHVQNGYRSYSADTFPSTSVCAGPWTACDHVCLTLFSPHSDSEMYMPVLLFLKMKKPRRLEVRLVKGRLEVEPLGPGSQPGIFFTTWPGTVASLWLTHWVGAGCAQRRTRAPHKDIPDAWKVPLSCTFIPASKAGQCLHVDVGL